MSCNEIGSPNRSRADVITRSTARRCDASVSSRHGKLEVSSLNALTCCIFSQGLSQLSGHGHGHHLLALALHAGDLLLAARHELFAGGRMPPVLEAHRDAVLAQLTEAHAHDDLVEGDELRHKLTRHARGHQHEAVLERFDDLGRTVTQEHLAAATLPAQVVHVVDISDQVRLLEPDDVPVFIRAHLRLPSATRSPGSLSHFPFGPRTKRFSARPTRAKSIPSTRCW